MSYRAIRPDNDQLRTSSSFDWSQEYERDYDSSYLADMRKRPGAVSATSFEPFYPPQRVYPETNPYTRYPEQFTPQMQMEYNAYKAEGDVAHGFQQQYDAERSNGRDPRLLSEYATEIANSSNRSVLHFHRDHFSSFRALFCPFPSPVTFSRRSITFLAQETDPHSTSMSGWQVRQQRSRRPRCLSPALPEQHGHL